MDHAKGLASLRKVRAVAGDMKLMREICQELYNRFGNRFYGVTSHGPLKLYSRDKIWWKE